MFKVIAGAGPNALVVDAQGDIGIGTGSPSQDLQVVVGNTPTLRLQQDGSAGFTAQSWDLAGNEAGFFIRDVTGGSQLPFRIIPGADSSALVIDDDNDIGMGAGTNPQAPLHVERTTDFVFLRLEASGASPNTSADITFTDAGADGELRYNIVDGDGPEMSLSADGALEAISSQSFNYLRLTANGAAPNTSADITFTDAGADGELRYNIVDGDGFEMSLDANGNMTIGGVLTQGSDRHAKTAVELVDGDEILAKLAALPVSSWAYKTDAAVRHIGPMAQDFHAIFGTGASETGISAMDTSGVALAAIQALVADREALIAEQAAVNAELLVQIERQNARLLDLEAALAAQ